MKALTLSEAYLCQQDQQLRNDYIILWPRQQEEPTSKIKNSTVTIHSSAAKCTKTRDMIRWT